MNQKCYLNYRQGKSKDFSILKRKSSNKLFELYIIAYFLHTSRDSILAKENTDVVTQRHGDWVEATVQQMGSNIETTAFGQWENQIKQALMIESW